VRIVALTILTNARDQKLIGYSNLVPCGHAGCAETLFLGDASLIAAVIFGLLIVCSKLRKLRQEKKFSPSTFDFGFVKVATCCQAGGVSYRVLYSAIALRDVNKKLQRAKRFSSSVDEIF